MLNGIFKKICLRSLCTYITKDSLSTSCDVSNPSASIDYVTGHIMSVFWCKSTAIVAPITLYISDKYVGIMFLLIRRPFIKGTSIKQISIICYINDINLKSLKCIIHLWDILSTKISKIKIFIIVTITRNNNNYLQIIIWKSHYLLIYMVSQLYVTTVNDSH